MCLTVSLFILLLIASVIADSPSICQKIIRRDSWGAKSPQQVEYAIKPVQYVVIHHTDTPECLIESDCKTRIFNMQHLHMEELQFNDIRYNFLVCSDGNVYEGAGWHKIGSHTRGYNTKSIGIGFIGSFTDKYPTSAAVRAAKDLLECGVKSGELEVKYKLLGACQITSTASPGLRLLNEIKTWDNWSAQP